MSALKGWIDHLAIESGFNSIAQSSRDCKLLCAQRFVRLFAYGTSFLILVQFLSSLDISDTRIGLFMTLTLLGDTVISFVLTLITDQVGRRSVLLAGSSLMAMSGIVFALSRNYWILVFASVVGVISPSGNEIGPFRAVEESILAQLTEKEKRSDIFAWYTLFGTSGAALGTLTCGWVVYALQNVGSWTDTMAYRTVFAFYTVLGLAKLGLTLALSSGVELTKASLPADMEMEEEEEGLLSESSDEERPKPSAASRPPHPPPKITSPFMDRIRGLLPHISPASRAILIRLILLFLTDSFASGLASPSWITYFFTTIHHSPASVLGTLFLVTNILAALSNLAALPIARRLGPLKTMVFTHLPSAILLGLVGVPPATPAGTWVAMALLSLRATTSSMDQAPRQAFLAAAVLPAERTAVLGVVNVIKTLAQAGGIGCSGVLAGAKLWVILFGGAGLLKVTYDLAMLWMFIGLKDREEQN